MSHLLTLKCTVLWRDLIGFLSSCLNGYESVRLFNNILLTYVCWSIMHLVAYNNYNSNIFWYNPCINTIVIRINHSMLNYHMK